MLVLLLCLMVMTDFLPPSQQSKTGEQGSGLLFIIVVRPNLPAITAQCAFLGNKHNKSLVIQTLRRGKVKASKLALKKDATMLSYMDVFVRIASNHEYVATAGEQFLFKLYGAERFATQNKFSHVAYKRSVTRTSTSNSFTLASLLPTTAAAMLATLIMGVSTGPAVVGERCLPPTEWGWETGEHNLIVIVTNHREWFSRYGVR